MEKLFFMKTMQTVKKNINYFKLIIINIIYIQKPHLMMGLIFIELEYLLHQLVYNH